MARERSGGGCLLCSTPSRKRWRTYGSRCTVCWSSGGAMTTPERNVVVVIVSGTLGSVHPDIDGLRSGRRRGPSARRGHDADRLLREHHADGGTDQADSQDRYADRGGLLLGVVAEDDLPRDGGDHQDRGLLLLRHVTHRSGAR